VNSRTEGVDGGKGGVSDLVSYLFICIEGIDFFLTRGKRGFRIACDGWIEKGKTQTRGERKRTPQILMSGGGGEYRQSLPEEGEKRKKRDSNLIAFLHASTNSYPFVKKREKKEAEIHRIMWREKKEKRKGIFRVLFKQIRLDSFRKKRAWSALTQKKFHTMRERRQGP